MNEAERVYWSTKALLISKEIKDLRAGGRQSGNAAAVLRRKEEQLREANAHVTDGLPAQHEPAQLKLARYAAAAPAETKDGWVGRRRDADIFERAYESAVMSPANAKRLQLFRPEYARAFVKYLRYGRRELDRSERDTLVEAKALSESSNVGGGYAAPVDFLPRPALRRAGLAALTDRCTHVTTSHDGAIAARVAANTGSSPTMNADAITLTWVSETPGTTTGTVTPTWEAVPIQVNLARALTRVSRNLLADAAFDLAGFIGQRFANAGALAAEQVALAGTGLAQPLGVINDAAVTEIASTVTGAISGTDVITLVGGLPEQYRRVASLFLSNDCLQTIRAMKDGSGRFLFMAGDAEHAATIAGLPYLVSDFLGTVASGHVPIFVGDPAGYWQADRQEITVDALHELYAEQNQVEYLGWLRVGGSVVIPEAFRRLRIS